MIVDAPRANVRSSATESRLDARLGASAMIRSPLTRIFLSLATLLLGPIHWNAVAGAEGQRYQLTIDSDLQVRYVGQSRSQAIAALTRLDYRLADRPDERDVTIDSVEVRVGSGGNILIESRMGREGARFRLGDQEPARYSSASAPPNLKRVLDEFGQIAVILSLDVTGVEIGRNVQLGPDSPLLKNGAIENALLFHPPFPSTESLWRAPARLPISGGQYASGDLNYEKVGEGPGGTIRVQVSGELVAEGKLQGGEVRKGSFKVSGEQFYNPDTASWTSGHWAIIVGFDLAATGPSPGGASGTMTLELKEVPTETGG